MLVIHIMTTSKTTYILKIILNYMKCLLQDLLLKLSWGRIEKSLSEVTVKSDNVI